MRPVRVRSRARRAWSVLRYGCGRGRRMPSTGTATSPGVPPAAGARSTRGRGTPGSHPRDAVVVAARPALGDLGLRLAVETFEHALHHSGVDRAEHMRVLARGV